MFSKLKTIHWREKINSKSIFIFLGVALIFFLSFRPPTDPDLGWHLMNGKYILEHDFQVARLDIFSYTMPDFPLIMHEWVTDLGMFVLYKKFGLMALSIIFAGISAGAFLLASFGTAAKKEHKITAAILATIASLPILGARPQMISLLALAAIIFIIFRFRQSPQTKLVYILPLIFLFWANLHGGFAIGLFFLAVFLIIETIKRFLMRWSEKIKENIFESHYLFKLGGILFVSALATLFNPYGWRIYTEVITTIFDTYTKKIIGEWMSVTISNPLSYQFAIYVVLLVILILFARKKIDLTYLVISAVFLYIATTSWRHMPIFLIVITPLWVNIVELVSGQELSRIISRKYFLALFILALAIISRQKINVVWEDTRSVEALTKNRYPYQAVEYLKASPIEGQMFNEYNWGGFLIWQYPEKKVFIDGRMPSWKIGDQRIFEDFNRIANGELGWENLLQKYDVNFALVYNNGFNRMKFEDLGWKKIYADDLALIYRKSD